MKTKLTILLTMIATAVMAGQANVVLSWTARPASENVGSYAIYEDMIPGRALMGHSTGTNFTILNVPNGVHNYFVTGINNFGEGIPSGSFYVNIFNQPFGSPGIPANLNGTVNYTWP